ncbi:unnamed protein product [Lactuca saligna]|uniref:Uncharacterized protein n=1 Tax=Lactuca saligna TaxID=75948 RepID=A0AA35ZRM0_LACSI|nr:unnamed protein product [Lactuca saligna]
MAIHYRAGADDKPLWMVKTVLHELVKLRGTVINGHLSMVPIDMEPQPIILAYIDLNLQTLAAARMLTPAGPVGETRWGDSMANYPMLATHSEDAQLKTRLRAMVERDEFRRRRNKATTIVQVLWMNYVCKVFKKMIRNKGEFVQIS